MMLALLAMLHMGLPPQDTTSGAAPVYVVAQLNRFGVSDQQGMRNRLDRIDAISRLGARGTRLGLEWNAIEPVRGQPNWALTDSVVAELRAANLQPYALLMTSPEWARPQGTLPSERPVVDGSAAKGDTAFASFAASAARRYHGEIHRWEIWNEPNLARFWIHVENGVNRGPDASDYVTLFRLARDSILAVDSTAEVAVGGLSSSQGEEREVVDPNDAGRRLLNRPAHEYLRALLRTGVRPEYVAIHPYSRVPPGVVPRGGIVPIFPDIVVDSVLGVLNDANLQTTQLWVTEWGFRQGPRRTDRFVRQWMDDGLRTLACNPRIALVTIYALTDPPTNRPNSGGMALVGADGSPTAIGGALQQLLHGGLHC